jgi:uncharacterized membrane protein
VWSWHTFWMLLHILGAVVAFGPMYTQPVISAMGRRSPQHAAVAAEISYTIATRFTLPFALTLPLTGWGLIAVEHIDFLDNTWLWVSVVLYAVALVFALAVQTPNVRRMLRIIRSRAAATAGEGPDRSTEIAAIGRRLALGGAFLGLVVTTIFVLMIWQPGGGAPD